MIYTIVHSKANKVRTWQSQQICTRQWERKNRRSSVTHNTSLKNFAIKTNETTKKLNHDSMGNDLQFFFLIEFGDIWRTDTRLRGQWVWVLQKT